MFGGIDFDPLGTVQGFFDTLDHIGFGPDGFFITLCGILLLVFFIWQMFQAAFTGRGSQVAGMFVRVVIAAALLALVPTAQELLRTGWGNTYNWAIQQVAAVQADRIADLEHTVSDLVSDGAGELAATVAAFFFDPPGGSHDIGDAAAVAVGATAAGTAARSAGRIAGRSILKSVFSNVFRLFRFLFIPIVAFYMVLIFVSGLIVGLATALLPLAAVLVASGNGVAMLLGLISKLLSSFASIVLIPLIFAVIFNIAILTPLKGILNLFNGIKDAIDDVTLNLDGVMTSGSIVWNGMIPTVTMPGVDFDKVSGIIAGIFSTIDAMFNMVFGGLIVVGAALLAAILIVSQLESIVAAMLQGIASTAGNATRVYSRSAEAFATGQAAGKAMSRASSKSRGGGGGRRSSTSQASSQPGGAPQGEMAKAEIGSGTITYSRSDTTTNITSDYTNTSSQEKRT